ncbi:MAG: dihydrolipoyl dehydrogenase, partial [Coxiellaceae bacterium]|nr:dihydrolipoyl dehydrogenase [Coxiellaceae bacterium]
MSNKVIKTKLVVLGSGPGGYSAAFRAADLGIDTIMVERDKTLGGVCLNVGCIPSKAYLHAAAVIDDAHAMAGNGIDFGKPTIDVDQLRTWKDGVVGRLTGGLASMAKQRKVNVINGVGKFTTANQLVVEGEEGTTTIEFEYAIIAAGSRSIKLPFMPEDPRIFDSTGALNIENPKAKMLVLGGGIIGLEMATVYEALGAEIHVVELMDQIMPGADKDLVAPLKKIIDKKYKSIMLKTKVTKVEAKKDGLHVTFEGENAPDKPQVFDTILESVGRRPNGDQIDAEKAGVTVDERGFIGVDKQMRTNVPHIFAIGDIVGQPMLAHKAVPEGRLAAEVIAGMNHFFDPKCIPSVAYTDPEVAWVGITETEAKEQGINYGKGAFPWVANGRSLAMERREGLTKLLFDNKTNRIIGGGIVGKSAGDLIAEVALAIEMGCEAEDLALTIHPHPTLVETIMQSAEAFEGTITDL